MDNYSVCTQTNLTVVLFHKLHAYVLTEVVPYQVIINGYKD